MSDFHAFEQRVSIEPWVKGGFGTVDSIVVVGDTVYIIDLKYGKGVKVFAKRNTQLMLYALGVYNDFGFVLEGITKAKLMIVQPRLDHVDEWEIGLDELLQWGDEVVRPAAIAALSHTATATPGEAQCKWCRAKGECTAFVDYVLGDAIEGFTDSTPLQEMLKDEPLKLRQVDKIDLDELGYILPKTKLLKDWISAIEARVYSALEQGESVPGHKLVSGRSTRTWSDEDEADKALAKFLKVDQRYSKKLISVPQAEKILGKKHKLFEKDLVVKRAGRPAIAPESDKRPAVNLSDAAEGFENT